MGMFDTASLEAVRWSVTRELLPGVKTLDNLQRSAIAHATRVVLAQAAIDEALTDMAYVQLDRDGHVNLVDGDVDTREIAERVVEKLL